MARAAGNSGPRLHTAHAVRYALGAVAGSFVMVLLHPAIGLPLAAAALAALVYGGRTAYAYAASVVGGLLTGLAGHATLYVVVLPLVGVSGSAINSGAFTALTIASLMLVGPGTVVLMRSGSPYRAVGLVIAGLSVMQMVTLWVFASAEGLTVAGFVGGAIEEMVAQAGVFGEMQDALASSWPALMVSMNGLAAILSVALVGRAGAMRGAAVRPLPPLAKLDLDPWLTVMPIAAIALLAASRLPVAQAGTAGTVGLNVLIVARWVFFLQGVAVFAGLYERAGFPRFTRAAGYALLGVTEALVPLVSLTGLADVWLNMRRLPRDGTGSKVVETPPDTD